ncbi:MAG TPA: ribosome small subunit-dependent GTPase A [Vicinamibacterales bacterium]|nr:ribosome small subunit-dependent GTPase A [Vicinamibacterales bacterium]
MQALGALGWDPFFDSQVTGDERARWTPARVVWEVREQYRLSTGEAEWRADLAGRLRHEAASRTDLPAVGDWVLAALRPAEGRATIHRCLARRSCFSRTGAGRSTEEQVVAANVDTVVIVTSFNRDFNVRRIERYLALAWESGARPIVLLNKADLCADQEAWRTQLTTETAAVSQGVPLLVTSAVSGEGMADLVGVVRAGGTTALLGSSGVGKSTLLNALSASSGERRQGVLPIRDGDDRGRHSTTARQLFCLPGGGVLIDTPGMRELQLWDSDAGLDRAFADIDALAAGCRFRDCAHDAEPGCAVAAAVERGVCPADRLDSYRRLQRENEFLRARHDDRARLERTRKAKEITKAARLQEKLRKRDLR